MNKRVPKHPHTFRKQIIKTTLRQVVSIQSGMMVWILFPICQVSAKVQLRPFLPLCVLLPVFLAPLLPLCAFSSPAVGAVGCLSAWVPYCEIRSRGDVPGTRPPCRSRRLRSRFGPEVMLEKNPHRIQRRKVPDKIAEYASENTQKNNNT